MKTEKLYYLDAYLDAFTASVVSCVPCGELYDIVLDRTAFFPEEGGQYSDRGYIEDAFVSNVYEENSVIYHVCDKSFTVGEKVSARLNFSERYEKMQCHTAEHILSGLIHKKYGLDNVGFHLGMEDVTMDISAPLTREELDEIEALANEIVWKNVDVTVTYPKPCELSSIEYRSKLDLTEDVRIVSIGEYDKCACCAPHVNRTGEIGIIRIIDFAGLRGGIRIRISAGRRAYNQIKELSRSVDKISKSLSVPRSEVACEVEKRLKSRADLEYKYRITRCELFTKKAEETIVGKVNPIVVFPDADAEEMRAVANSFVGKTNGILIILSGEDGDYKYNISSSDTDLRATVKDMNSKLCGRGGGRPNMVTGTFLATLSEISDYFK